jgi:hypothetical protein
MESMLKVAKIAFYTAGAICFAVSTYSVVKHANVIADIGNAFKPTAEAAEPKDETQDA